MICSNAFAKPSILSALTARGAPQARTSIVAGSSVAIARFPFQVALYDPRAGSVAGGFFCGGVIVNATHVVTAAHCVIDDETERVVAPEHIAVLAGASRLSYSSQASASAGVVEDPAAATAYDPAYNRASSDYDVGVITLKRPLWTSPTPPARDGLSAIAPIPVDPTLAASYANPDVSGAPIVATVSGWGDTRPEPSSGLGSYPNDLQAVRVPLIPAETCAEDYADPFASQPITAQMLCAGGQAGGGDSCFGDSGGPLVVDRDNPPDPPSDYVLAGLVSFGDGCAQNESPGVYARIADPRIASFLNSDPAQSPALGLRSGRRPGSAAVSPRLRVVSKGCTRTRCTIAVASAARTGAAEVHSVRATLGFREWRTCSRRGVRVACVRQVSRTPLVHAIAAGKFLVVADHLRPGRCTFKLTAINSAGLRQPTPTRVALTVR